MPHYALTDSLVVLCALYSAWSLTFPVDRFLTGKMAAAGFLTIAIAALAGALRFTTGDDILFETPHLMLSSFAGIVGFLWIATALFGWTANSSPIRKLMWPVAPTLFAATVKLDLIQETLIVCVFLLLLAQINQLTRMIKVKENTGIRGMVPTLTLFLLIFPMDYLPKQHASLGWHFYHTLLALWIVALTITFRKFRSEHLEFSEKQ